MKLSVAITLASLILIALTGCAVQRDKVDGYTYMNGNYVSRDVLAKVAKNLGDESILDEPLVCLAGTCMDETADVKGYRSPIMQAVFRANIRMKADGLEVIKLVTPASYDSHKVYIGPRFEMVPAPPEQPKMHELTLLEASDGLKYSFGGRTWPVISTAQPKLPGVSHHSYGCCIGSECWISH